MSCEFSDTWAKERMGEWTNGRQGDNFKARTGEKVSTWEWVAMRDWGTERLKGGCWKVSGLKVSGFPIPEPVCHRQRQAG